MKLVSGCQNNRRQEQVEKELIVKGNDFLNRRGWGQSNDQTDEHAYSNMVSLLVLMEIERGRSVGRSFSHLPPKIDNTVSCTAWILRCCRK